MEEIFVKQCESILKQDISKWDSNKIFFKDLLEFYDQKVEQKRL